MCDCGISWSYSLTFVSFGQGLHQANRLNNLVQLFNAESHAIGIKSVHEIDDAIAKFVFDKCVEKNWYVYFPDNSEIEWLIQFSCDNIALLSNIGYRIIHITLYRDHVLVAQFWNSLIESLVQQNNIPAKLAQVLTRFQKLDKAKLSSNGRLNRRFFYNKTEYEIEKDSYKCT